MYHMKISLFTVFRSPKTVDRPSFQGLCRQLSLPDTRILQWSEEDKRVHPEAAKLGAELVFGEALYVDVQNRYQNVGGSVRN